MLYIHIYYLKKYAGVGILEIESYTYKHSQLHTSNKQIHTGKTRLKGNKVWKHTDKDENPYYITPWAKEKFSRQPMCYVRSKFPKNPCRFIALEQILYTIIRISISVYIYVYG